MKAKWWQGILAMLAVFVMSAAPASAAVPTDPEIASVMAGGQKYLLTRFHSDGDTVGHWGAYSRLAETASAVAALLETGKYSDPLYTTVIDKGVQYILSKAQLGGEITESGDETYETGLALVALDLYGRVAPPAKINAAYDAVVLNAVNYFKNGQNTDGGWRYSPNYGASDMSATQFGVMGLYYGSHHLGLTIDANTAGTWAYKLYGYIKTLQQSSGDGSCAYMAGSGSGTPTLTGACLWSLYLIGKEQSTEATNALTWFGNKYASQLAASRWGDDYGYGQKNYYGLYAIAKALSGVLGSANPLLGSSGTPLVAHSFNWLDDLKTYIYDNKTPDNEATPTEYNWIDNDYLGSYPDISTAFVLMSMTFADPNTPSPEKRLPEPVGSDVPVANQGTVDLETDGIVKISAPARGNIAAGTVDTGVELPVGSFDFRLSGLTTLTTVLRITPAAGSLDQTNPLGFLNADGTIKAGLAWFKLIGGAWKGLPSVPITLGPEDNNPATPYTYIEITLTDNGPEDTNPAVGVIDDPGAPGVGFVAPAGGTSGSDAKCFIATAAFGSSMAPDVMVLRQFRDRYLKTNALGQMFVDAYYSVSPPIANFIAQHDTLRAATRAVLSPIIFTVKYPLGSLGILILAALGGVFWVRRRNALD